MMMIRNGDEIPLPARGEGEVFPPPGPRPGRGAHPPAMGNGEALPPPIPRLGGGIPRLFRMLPFPFNPVRRAPPLERPNDQDFVFEGVRALQEGLERRRRLVHDRLMQDPVIVPHEPFLQDIQLLDLEERERRRILGQAENALHFAIARALNREGAALREREEWRALWNVANHGGDPLAAAALRAERRGRLQPDVNLVPFWRNVDREAAREVRGREVLQRRADRDGVARARMGRRERLREGREEILPAFWDLVERDLVEEPFIHVARDPDDEFRLAFERENPWLWRRRPISVFIGPNPVVFPEAMDAGVLYRWFDPKGQPFERRNLDGCLSALPPGALPLEKPPGRIRRWWSRASGAIWWQTSVPGIRPQPGDVLVSFIGSTMSADCRYFANGDWDLARVLNIQCGRRQHALGPLYVHVVGDLRWQARVVTTKCRTPRWSLSWDPLTKGVLGLQLSEARPVFIPRGKDWERSIMEDVSASDDATIRNRFEAVIRATPEHLVAAMRMHMGAALRERDLNFNPCEALRRLEETDALLRVRLGATPAYGPR